MDKNTQTEYFPPAVPQEKFETLISDFLSRVSMEYESLCTDIIPYLPEKRFNLSQLLDSARKKQTTDKARELPPSGLHHRVPRCDLDFQIWCAQRDLAEINLLLQQSPYNQLKDRYGTGTLIEDRTLREEPFINMLETINREKDRTIST